MSNTEGSIARQIGSAIARLPEEDYNRLIGAPERHEAQIWIRHDGDHVVIYVEDLPWCAFIG